MHHAFKTWCIVSTSGRFAKKSHPRQNASGLLISTHPSDCNASGDFMSVHVSAVRCTQIALKPVYVQLRLDIKNKIPIIIGSMGRGGIL